MCQFFSFVTNGNGEYMYFDWEKRKTLLKSNPNQIQPDSHTSIADYFGYTGAKEDKLNKYEYNPLTKVFEVDYIGARKDDRVLAGKWVRRLNFKKVVEPLIIKKIINPLNIRAKLREDGKPRKEDILILKKWDSVWNSVGGSVWNSVRNSVGGSVGGSVGDSVRGSVGDSVWDSVRNSVRNSVGGSVGDSVRGSVGDSVWDSVRNSVRTYIFSFFKIKFEFDFSCGVELWNRGLMPSFDGKIWRLHIGEKAKIVFEISQEDLRKFK